MLRPGSEGQRSCMFFQSFSRNYLNYDPDQMIALKQKLSQHSLLSSDNDQKALQQRVNDATTAKA